MKNATLVFLSLFFIIGCSENKKEQKSETEIKKEVLAAFNSMYDTYAKGTDEYFQYYEEDFIRVVPSGKITSGIEKPKKEWNEYLKGHSLYIESYSEPELVISEDQVITIGDFVEYFIDKETNDSTYNRGVYIAAWEEQEDGSWKISMDTWHAGLDQE
ncbi:nuclear transport factor 2 family protein [Gramella jeungdoensis]|uniref:Nuclear transport factor 2 family protein n=1 Tax=Gramella jeungdoensis TaxID=708091 RepID=A0ABT0YYM1_9FLAO|nr:nuclear transport factor 2 family protein [Gramella jeungdoensis]MCM8568571.1 nuclear transport factor 2 family protein [Gramella jeungdoensis]